nr:BamA/TamA family outer membrane protein [Xenococcaceae cyanobacterium MO_234.B1]
GLSWNAKAEAISSLPNEGLVRWDKVTKIQNDSKSIEFNQVQAGLGGVASAVAGQTLYARSLNTHSNLDSSSTIPLLVKQPKSQPVTLLPLGETSFLSSKQKPQVLSDNLNIFTNSQQVPEGLCLSLQGIPCTPPAKTVGRVPSTKSRKNALAARTPDLNEVAAGFGGAASAVAGKTLSPRSLYSQSNLDLSNTIPLLVQQPKSQPVTLLPLEETSFLSSKQKPQVLSDKLNIFTNSQQVPEGLCLSLQGIPCTPPAMTVGRVPSTKSRKNALAARTPDLDEVAAGFGEAASAVTGKTLYTLSHDNSDKDNSDKVEAGEGCLTCFDNTVVRNGSETLASNSVRSNTVLSNTVRSNTLIGGGLQGEGTTLAPRRDAGELPSLISAVPHSPSSAKGTPEYPTLNRRIDEISPILIGQEEQPPEAETPPPTDTETPIQTTPQTEQLPDFSQPTTPPEETTTPPEETTTPPEETTTPPEEPRVLVAEVAVMGVEGELKDIVYQAIDTEPGRTTTRSQLQEDVNAVYATGFFQNVEVTPEDTPLGVRISFLVKSNPVLNQVKIQTLPPEANKQVLPPEKLDEIFQDTYGVILNLQELQDGIKKINEWYSENGYELAQVVGSPEVSPDGIVTLIVTEGIIETIQVQFFDKENEPAEGVTRDFIVTREVQLKPGDVFKRNIAQRDLQRVFGLGLFEDVRLSFSPGEDPSKVVLNVEVVESSTGSVSAGGGFSSASGFFGTISYQQQNLGGNNQTISGEFQGGERELLFDLNFTDPWIGGDPYRTSYNINFFRRRSISLVFDGDDNDIETEDGEDSPRVVRTGGGVNFARPLADNPFTRAEWNLSTGFRYQRVQIKNADGDISPRSTEEDGNKKLAFSDSGEDDLLILRFAAARDRRNNRFQPTRGYLLRLSLDQSLPIGSGTIALNRIRASYSYFIPVSFFNFTEGPQALAFNAQAGSVVGDLPPYEAFVLGGSNSVRGYREGEVGSGRRYFQGTVEYRFPVFRIIGAALFFDYGSVLGTDADVPGTPSRIRGLPGNGYGYGAGVRIQSPLGPIRIDYGINDEDDTRIHFGIGERF